MDLDYKQIGQRIARCRKKAGLTQAALSEMVDISPTYMSSIERAVSIPSTEVIMRLAIALVVGLHLWKRQILLSIAGGTVCYMLLVQFLF